MKVCNGLFLGVLTRSTRITGDGFKESFQGVVASSTDKPSSFLNPCDKFPMQAHKPNRRLIVQWSRDMQSE